MGKWEKGKSGNPAGRPPESEDLRTLKKLNRTFIEMRLTHWLRKPLNELTELLKDKDQEAIDHFICKIILMGIVHGDHKRLGFIFDRVVGKVVEQIETITVQPFLIEGEVDGKTRKVTLGSKEKDI